MEGFILHEPTIQFRDKAQLRNGNMTNRGALYESHHFENWLFVYSVNVQRDVD